MLDFENSVKRERTREEGKGGYVTRSKGAVRNWQRRQKKKKIQKKKIRHFDLRKHPWGWGGGSSALNPEGGVRRGGERVFSWNIFIKDTQILG